MRTRRCTPPSVLSQPIGVVALDLDGRRLDARLFARRLLQVLDLVAVLLGPARVHAHQHVGPVLALGAAGAGMHFEIGVVAVGLARQQRLELAPRGFGLELASAPLRPRRRPLRPSRPRRARSCVTWSSSSWLDAADGVELSSSAVRSCITRCARAESFQRWGLRPAGSARRAAPAAVSKSKMPPQQPDRLLDVLDDRLDFRAHGSTVPMHDSCDVPLGRSGQCGDGTIVATGNLR